MQIKALLVFLPLLLGPVSSAVVPAVPDPCGAVARRSVDARDVPEGLMRRCAARREIESHIESLHEDIHRRELSWGQDHTLLARAGKKKGSQTTDTTAGQKPAAQANPVSLPSRPKEGDSSQPKDDKKTTADKPASGADKSKKPDESADKKGGKDKKPAGGSDPSKDGDNAAEQSGGKKDKGKGKGKANDKDTTMYHIVTPNPNKQEGVKDLETGDQSYFRKIGDGDVNASGRYGTHNPSYSAVESKNQVAKDPETNHRPGKVEENAWNPSTDKGGKDSKGTKGTKDTTKDTKDTTKDNKGNKGTTGKHTFSHAAPRYQVLTRQPEWYKVTPKKQEDLPKDKTQWTDENLRNNL